MRVQWPKTGRFRSRRVPALVLAAGFCVGMAGCSVSGLLMKHAGGALGGAGAVFSGDDDPELIADALPFALKTFEALSQAAPTNDALLLATGSAYTMYAYAFLQFRADTLPDSRIAERKDLLAQAKKLYLRGYGYVMRALDVRHPGFSSALRGGNVDSLLACTVRADTAILYWAGAAWMGALTSDKFDMALAAEMPKAVAMLKRSLDLDETFARASAHDFFISYYGSMPASMGGSEQKAREHFQKTVALTGGTKASPYLSLATSVCIAKQNAPEFRDLLHKALAIDLSAAPNDRLANTLSQRKARWLLDNVDNFFLSADSSNGKDGASP